MPKASAPQKLKVFISYSRRDLAFAERLVAALEARGIETLIDKRDLPLAEEWQRELLGFIRAADCIAFVVSPASIGSKWCAWEVEQVHKLSKRLAPVIGAEVDETKVPDGIRKINYVFFTGEHAAGAGFERQADALAAALKTDLAWIKEHTRIGELARRWSERGQPGELLLRARELEHTEAWRARQPPEAPGLTPLHRELISASRLAATHRLRNLLIASIAGLFLAVSLAGFALWQRQQALAENRRFETFFDLISSESTFAAEDASNVEDPVELAERVLKAGRNLARRDVRGVKVLWVDDNQGRLDADKQRFRQTMRRLGVEFVPATTVGEAEEKLKTERHINLVITDFKHVADRPGETPAGYRVLEFLQKTWPNAAPPLIIYSSVFTPTQADEAKCRGAVAQTGTRGALFTWVLIALDDGRAYRPSEAMRAYCTALKAASAPTQPAGGARDTRRTRQP